MRAPLPRGPLSGLLLDVLAQPVAGGHAADLVAVAGDALDRSADVLRDDDVQLALFCLYALHGDGIEGVAEEWEWHPDLATLRAVLEPAFERALRDRVPAPQPTSRTAGGTAATLFALTAADTGPSLSRFVASKATEAQLRELMVHRSIYTLHEADPHTWAIPRLTGRAKAALVEIQSDEYGGGRPERMHAELFAATLRGLGLDDRYGGYLDQVPALVLTSVNLMMLFGLNRRLRGAAVGHLAAFEMTSSAPNRLYGNGFRRLGHGSLSEYFDEHVEADAVHEQIAAHDLAGGLVEAEPALAEDVLFGAAACLAVDGWVAAALLGAWTAGGTALRTVTATAA